LDRSFATRGRHRAGHRAVTLPHIDRVAVAVPEHEVHDRSWASLRDCCATAYPGLVENVRR